MRATAAAIALIVTLAGVGAAQQAPDYRAADADRQVMLDRLGIKTLRPGADGFNKAAPNAANYDESKVGDYTLPDVLRLTGGKRVTTAAQWWKLRRPQIVALFDREIYGRVPATAPRITWHFVKEETGTEAGMRVVKRWYEGVADNAAWPKASARIKLRYTLPAKHEGPVPMMLSFGFPEGFKFPGPPRPPEPGPSYTEQLLLNGWGYATLEPNTVQQDNGGFLNDGVIGISLRGKPRSPTDWGVLRAWAWGADRAFDLLATDKRIDTHRIGIEGLSRWGKASLVTMAYDPRFTIGLIGSSGAGGAALYRRNFGERMGNLTAGGEYHWFAGNFLKYDGPLTQFDLPIDSHMLIALAAPRPIFIGGGTAASGDGWVDVKGSFLAASAASPVWALLGKPGLDTAEFPPLLTPVTGGRIGFYEHEGGHNERPNWPIFIAFANSKLGIAAPRH